MERWKFCFVMGKFHMSPPSKVVWKIFFSYSIRRKMFFSEVLSPSDLVVVFFCFQACETPMGHINRLATGKSTR